MAESNSKDLSHIEQFGLKSQENRLSFFHLDLQKPQDRIKIAMFVFVALGILVLSVGAGMFLFSGSASGGDDIKIIEGSGSAVSGELVLHIDGAVSKPGVYHLPSGSRINDAVAAAGGLTNSADMSKINLAAKLGDGQKVHIASISDTGSAGTPLRQGFEGQASITGSESSGLVSINSASQSQLEGLPGIGPVTAGKIIAARPYSSIDELVSKKAVGKSTFEKIKDLVTF